MRIGIDISQLAYQNTGVAKYLQNFVTNLLKVDKTNDYVLFFSSLTKTIKDTNLDVNGINNVTVKQFKMPPIMLDLIWNRLHIMPVESLIGDIDVFITSDWTEPPVRKAKKATILYDLIIFTYPEETDKSIRDVQMRKLKYVIRESQAVFCISESTKKDATDILGIDEKRLFLAYPGIIPGS